MANLEAGFAIVKKEAAKPKGNAAGPAAKGKAGAPTTKEKVKRKGNAAAPKAKGKAAEPKGKGKAATASGAEPPGEFDIDDWIATHITRGEARTEPKRRNFVSNIHKRSKSAAELCGVYDVQPITKRARDAVGDLHDSVHKKG